MVAITTGLLRLITPNSGKFEWVVWEVGIVPIALTDRERPTLPTANLYQVDDFDDRSKTERIKPRSKELRRDWKVFGLVYTWE